MDCIYSATVERDEEGFFIDFPASSSVAFANGDTIGIDLDGAMEFIKETRVDESLRGFEYADPGFGCPEWWVDAANRLLKMQLEAVI